MKLIFDLETNGFGNDSSVLSFSALLINENNKIVEEIDRYYVPNRGESYNQEAIEVNGLNVKEISSRRAKQNATYPMYFKDDRKIVELFDKVDTLIAHNIDFDAGFVSYHLGIDVYTKKQFCTMRKIQYLYPAPYIHKSTGEPKFPKLSEAVEWAKIDIEEIKKRTGKEYHDSLFDVHCTYEVYKYLLKHKES